MSKCTEIREFCGDYAFDVEYSKDFSFTMYFNSLRNAQTVKRCIEVDDSVPNVATAVDFVEVVRCKDCKYWKGAKKPDPITNYHYGDCTHEEWQDAEGWDKTTCGHEFCSRGERKEQG